MAILIALYFMRFYFKLESELPQGLFSSLNLNKD